MKQTRKVLGVLAVSSCLFFSMPVVAQTGDGGSTTTTTVADDDDNDGDDNGKIGLAGLLGLLGLLGLRKKDDHRHTTTVRRD
jgi:MYXO-CTERM domain-containing protein